MTLDFIDGIQLMALVIAVVYGITAWQNRRCFNNVNEFNNAISAILVRQAILAENVGVDLPSLEDLAGGLNRPIKGHCAVVPKENGNA